MRRALLLVGCAVLGAAGCTCSGSKAPERTPDAGARDSAAVQTPGAAALAVPRLRGTLKLDGETTEPVWHTASRTRAFTDASGAEARPFSEASFLWDAENLYVLLYAADNDIRAQVTAHDGPVWIDDHFTLHLTPTGTGQPTYAFDISATGVVTDAKRAPGGKDDVSWESGIKLGVDRDGDLNDDSRDDEEWVVEAAIPLGPMGIEGKPGTRILIDVARCDTPRKTKEKRCGAWGTATAPRVLELKDDGPVR